MRPKAIAFLGALGVEVRGLRRALGLKEIQSGPARHLYRGEIRNCEILLAETGAGRERVEEVVTDILDHRAVCRLVSFGFAGALSAPLQVGDLVICSTLLTDPDGSSSGARQRLLRCDADLLRRLSCALNDSKLRFHIGSSVTVSNAICAVEEKRALHEALGADIVDMESYWIAALAAQRKIPFAEIRVVSDAQDEGLPPFDEWLTPDGRWRWRSAARYLVGNPRRIASLLRLSRNAQRASAALTAALGCVASALIVEA